MCKIHTMKWPLWHTLYINNIPNTPQKLPLPPTIKVTNENAVTS